MERHGVTEADASTAEAYARATCRATRMRLAGAQTGGSSASARAHATTSSRMADVCCSSASSGRAPAKSSRVADVPLAEDSTFWRTMAD